MTKEKAIKLLKEEVETLNAKASNFSHAIDVRRVTVERTAKDLKGIKSLIKMVDRNGLTKRYANGIYGQMVEDHNQHLAVLCQLKSLLKDVREEIFLKEYAISAME